MSTKKQLIEELIRINQMMGLNTNSNKFLVEQMRHNISQKLNIPYNSNILLEKSMDDDDIDDKRWPTYELGPREMDVDYVGFNTKPTLILGPRDGTPPQVWQIKSDTKIENIIDASAFGGVKYGDVPSENKEQPIMYNQPYVEVNGAKFCLPSKDWFDVYATFEPVYKFKNPKTKKEYAIQMTIYPESASIDGKKLTGSEISRGCYGGDNGWKFITSEINDPNNNKGPSTPYREVGGELYWNNSNQDMFDSRSDNDIFWDEWGLKIEIAVGIVISILVPPLGAAIGAGFAALTGIRLGVTAAKVAIVSFEILAELTALWPYIKNSWNRGDQTNATVTALFCFLPILMQAKKFSKLITNGVEGTYDTAKVGTLLQKIANYGGFSKIYSKNYEKELDMFKKGFYDLLDEEEKAILNAGNKMVKNVEKMGEKMAEKEINAVIEGVFKAPNNQRKLAMVAERAKNYKKGSFEEVVFKIAWGFSENVSNVVAGRGLIPTFGRGIVLIGPIAIALEKVADLFYTTPEEQWEKDLEKRLCEYLKRSNPESNENPETCLEKVITAAVGTGKYYADGTQKPAEVLSLDEQLNAMALLYTKLGWNDKFKEKLNQNLQVELEKVKSGDVSGIDAKTLEEATNKAKQKLIEETKKELESSNVAALLVDNKELTVRSISSMQQFIVEEDIFDKIIQKLGYNDMGIIGEVPSGFDTPWNVTIDGKEGKIEFISVSIDNLKDYNIIITLEGNEIYPNKGNITTTTTTTNDVKSMDTNNTTTTTDNNNTNDNMEN